MFVCSEKNRGFSDRLSEMEEEMDEIKGEQNIKIHIA